MPIQPGDRIPDIQVAAVTAGPIRGVSTLEIFAGRRAVLFGLPGAFTPTCSDSHLPGFEVRAFQIRSLGIDVIACFAVNDAFVMRAWAKARKIEDEILMLADGNAELARALDLELDVSQLAPEIAAKYAALGMQRRVQRFSAIVEDGVVRSIHVETGATEVTVSSAEAIVAELEATAKSG